MARTVYTTHLTRTYRVWQNSGIRERPTFLAVSFHALKFPVRLEKLLYEPPAISSPCAEALAQTCPSAGARRLLNSVLWGVHSKRSVKFDTNALVNQLQLMPALRRFFIVHQRNSRAPLVLQLRTNTMEENKRLREAATHTREEVANERAKRIRVSLK
jgi:hypothetical protein